MVTKVTAKAETTEKKTTKKRAIQGNGSVYKTTTSTGKVLYRGSFVADGKRYYVSGATQKEANENLKKAQQEHQQGTLVPVAKDKVADFLTYWIDIHAPTIGVTTGPMYRSHINHHIIPALGYIPLQKLTTDKIQKFYGDLIEEGLEASSIKFIHSVFSCALNDAVEWGKIGRNPALKVKLPRGESHEIMPLSEEQAQALLEAAQGHDFMECLLTLALNTGMRKGELLALHWNDIDFSKNVVHVRRTLSFVRGKGLQERDPKTKASRRDIELSPLAIEALHAQRTRQIKARLQGGEWNDKGLVFCDRQGNYLWFSHVQKDFKKVLHVAKLPDITRFHDLRHTFATLLLSHGEYPKIVQQILGHTSIKITMDVYGHCLPSMQKNTMLRLDSLLRKQTTLTDVM